MIGSPRISAIIPVYNAERYIVKCLDTVLAQVFDDFEVIAINDCSKDNSRSILDGFAQKDKRIKCVHLEKNGGVSHARNLGISLAKGEYITFIDADDYIDSDYFSAGLSNDTLPFDLVISGLKTGNEGHFSISLPPVAQCTRIAELSPIFHELDSSSLLLGPYNKFYLTSLLQQNDIQFPSFSLGEDQCFVLNVLEHCQRIKTVHYAGYYYIRQDSPSLSRGVQRAYDEVAAFLSLKFSLKNKVLQLIGRPLESQEAFQENNLLMYITRIFALYSNKKAKPAKARKALLAQNRREPWMKYYKASDFGKKFNLMKWPLIYMPVGIADPLLNRLFKIWYAKR